MFIAQQPINSANENYVQPSTLALKSEIEVITTQNVGLAERKQIMGSLPTLDFPNGRIGFASLVLGWDEEPRDAFRIELPGWPVTYGEWRPKFADNQNDFDVEIVSVGYINKGFLGSQLVNHRKKFSAQEQQVIEELVRNLFADRGARGDISPFSSKIGEFLGGVVFVPGWILRSDL
jgi:hypothetical protein